MVNVTFIIILWQWQGFLESHFINKWIRPVTTSFHWNFRFQWCCGFTCAPAISGSTAFGACAEDSDFLQQQWQQQGQQWQQWQQHGQQHSWQQQQHGSQQWQQQQHGSQQWQQQSWQQSQQQHFLDPFPLLPPCGWLPSACCIMGATAKIPGLSVSWDTVARPDLERGLQLQSHRLVLFLWLSFFSVSSAFLHWHCSDLTPFSVLLADGQSQLFLSSLWHFFISCLEQSQFSCCILCCSSAGISQVHLFASASFCSSTGKNYSN